MQDTAGVQCRVCPSCSDASGAAAVPTAPATKWNTLSPTPAAKFSHACRWQLLMDKVCRVARLGRAPAAARLLQGLAPGAALQGEQRAWYSSRAAQYCMMEAAL